MRILISVVLGFGLAAAGLVAATGCGGGGGGAGGGGGDETSPGAGNGGDGGAGGACSSADFEAQVIAICKAQNPPSPAPGEMGASCADGTQCDSSYCLEPFGNAAYCSLLCPAGNECPIGYACQDTGTADGAACYQTVCVYGGTDSADCTKNLLDEVDTACHSECTAAKVHGWMDCLEGAGRVCGPEDAAEKCGPERGLVESCCLACDTFDW